MKKTRKGLACLLAAIMVLTTLPAGALAAEGDISPANDTPVCNCETACPEGGMNAECPVCGVDGALPENCGQYQTPEPTAAEQVQTLIDVLPTAEELPVMTQEEQQAVYTQLCEAYDAYEVLSDEQKAEIVGTEIFDALFAVFNGMTNTLADSGFTVVGGTLNTDYTLSDNTLTINNNTPLTISGGTAESPITGQIVIAENVSADLTLNGVNISATNAKSAIELSSGSSLTLTLSQNSENALAGAAGTTDSGAPGIHVPQNAALTVLCAAAGDDSGHICDSSNCAKLTIQGGSSAAGFGGVGIGGGITITEPGSSTDQPCGTVLLLGGDITVTGGTSTSNGKARDIGGSDGTNAAGGTGGTVIILTGVQSSSGSLDIGGGSGGGNVDNGAGIKPGTDSNTYEIYGSLELPADLTIPAGVTVNIPSGTTLTVPSGKTLTNYGSITGEGTLTGDGAFTNHGTVNVTNNQFNNNNTVVGAFNITGGTKDTDYTYADNVLTVNDGANLTISMADNTATTSDRIVIAQNATATITLNGVSISAPNEKSAIEIPSGSTLTLILPKDSENSLVGGENNTSIPAHSGGAGIQVPSGATLNIKCSENGNDHTCEESSCGSLSVKGNPGAAGIGGKPNESCGTVTIDGGIVTATSGASAAGIGGGDNGIGGDITINGGSVTAIGDGGGAGIGGAGGQGPGGKVTITGGIVTASDTPGTAEDGNASGIGGGYESAGGEVIIIGGVVIATGHGGAGIGGGTGATDGTFNTTIDSTTGNAVIFASGTDGDIGDLSNYSNWSGVIFQGAQGFVYGNVTLTDSFTIPSGYTLTIPDGATLTIPDGATITNNGTIDVVDSGKIEPESRVSGSGDICQFYTVTFDANGHGTAPKETLVLKNGFIAQPTAPTEGGYIFGGWYKDAECNIPWNFDTDTVTEKTTLYAKWTKDETPPTGTITVKENKWKSFINTITFNVFCKDKYDVTITAEDNETGVKSVEYLLSETAISVDDIKMAADWIAYSAFSLEKDGKYIIYAKITDNSNNIAYISTNGMILDSQNPTKPTVSGYISGTWTNRDVTLTVSDATALSGIAKYEYSTNGGASWNEMTVTVKTEASSTAPANVVKAQLTVSGATDTAYLIRAVSNTGAYSETASVTVKIETTAPTIEGIANGETYCPNHTFTVSDDHLKEVIINNAPAQAENGVYTLTTEGECTVTATDEAGNSVTYTVTVGHNWNDTTYEWSEDGKTCTATRTCKNDSTHIETAKATVTGTQTKAPTCTEKGETTYTAAFAEAWAESKTTIRADIPAAGHSYEHHDAVSPECEQSGMEEHYTCKNCDLIFDKDKKETDKDALVISATGHTFSTEWKFTEDKHWHECSCGAKTEESAHTFEWEIDKEAQVGVAGSKHEECTGCGYAKAAVEIPALKAPEYPPVIDGSDGGKVTVNPENPQAGDEVMITPKPEGGKMVDKVIVTDENGKEIAITDNGDGIYTFTQPDGKVTVKVTFKTEESKPSTDEKSTQTGDNNNMWLWFAILFVSGGGAIGTTIYGRKKKHGIK